MLRRCLIGCLFALPWTAGCASTVPPYQEGPGGTAELTVRVWSTAVQAPVPGRGSVVELGSGARQRFDTGGLENISQSFVGLRPGLYEVRAEERWDGRRVKPVQGALRIYLEPGARESVDVIAADQTAGSSEGSARHLPPSSESALVAIPPR